MIVYHKVTAEITGDDGREWLVTVEPPMHAPPQGEPTKWEVQIIPQLTRSQEERGVSKEPFTYTVPCHGGMFEALGMALNLVPQRPDL